MKQIADISHNNGSFDPVEYAKKHDRIRLKATQGTGFQDPTYAERVSASHKAGLAVDHYHFMSGEDGTAQADYFIGYVRPHLKSGDRFMADDEVAGVTGLINSAFIKRCTLVEPDYDGLVYGPPYFLRDNRIVSVDGWGLVLADYTTAKSPVFWPPGFEKVPLEWQFTMTAHTSGISGESDLSRVVRAKPEATDLTRFQARHTRLFEKSMNDRKHRMTPKAESAVDGALTAATKAKAI